MKYRRLCCLLLAVAVNAGAEVKPAALFADHAVLQRDKPVPIWGIADPGEKVSVTFASHRVETTADAAGRWRVELPALSASAESRQLLIQGKNTVTLTDILVGEVWLASGQSNMARTLGSTSFDTAFEYPASADFAMIREFTVAHAVAGQPAADVTGAWQPAGPKALPQFSAAAYFFARDLYTVLRVPVGIINSSWGATSGEAWTEGEALRESPVHAAVQQRWNEVLAAYPAAKVKYDAARAAWAKRRADAVASGEKFTEAAPAAPPGPGHHSTPSGLYNGMIAPLAPAALRGVIWYQGENNARVPRAVEYRQLFPALITGWRRAFAQGDFPFYWVQLANFASGDAQGTVWATLRESQTLTLALSNTGQAVAIDIGNVADIHPKNKRDVGRRLARLALRRTYGLDFVDSGPVFDTAAPEGAGWRISFTHTEGGLLAPLNALSGFELAGEDRVFHPAEAKIEKNSVLVTSPTVPAPVAVRYAWRNAPVAGLFNGEGLPAVPFRTDTW
jgi:sialate O-acetylesterase